MTLEHTNNKTDRYDRRLAEAETQIDPQLKWNGSGNTLANNDFKIAPSTLDLLSGLAQGMDFNQYIGRQIYLKRVHIKGVIQPRQLSTTTFQDNVRFMIVVDKQAESTIDMSKLFYGAFANRNLNLLNLDYLNMRYKVYADHSFAMAPIIFLDNEVITCCGQAWTKGQDTPTDTRQLIRTFQDPAWTIGNQSDGFKVRNVGIAGGGTGPWSSDVFGLITGGGGAIAGGTGTINANSTSNSANNGQWTSVNQPWKRVADTEHENNLYYKREDDELIDNNVITVSIGSPSVKDLDLCIDLDTLITIGRDASNNAVITTNKPWFIFAGSNPESLEWRCFYTYQYEYYDV